MKKKILITEFYNYSPILETGLELALKNLFKNNIVHYYFLGHSVQNDAGMIWPRIKDKIYLIKKKLPEYRGIKKITQKKNKNFFYSLEINLLKKKIKLPIFRSYEQIKNYKYDNFDVGAATLSSLISKYQDPFLDLKKIQNELKKIIIDSISVYNFTKERIDNIKPDLVYLFNSRLSYPRAILRACEIKKINYKIYDRGNNFRTYNLKEQSFINKKKFQKEYLKKWKKFDKKDIFLNKFDKWFLERKQGDVRSQNHRSFIDGNSQAYIKKNKKRLVTYFSSSQDEFESLSADYKNYFYSQTDAIYKLIKVAAKLSNIHLVVRLHPNIKNKTNKEKLHWIKLCNNFKKYKNLEFIMHNENTSSYDLLLKSDIIFSSGSTLGLEAVYYGKPSVLLAPSLYDNLGINFFAKNESQIYYLLKKKKFRLISKSKLMPYVYFRLIDGNQNYKYFKYFDSGNLEPYAGSFLGENINKKSFMSKIFYKMNSIY